MKGQTHGGKGSTPRPTNKRRFDENYEAIFNKKAPEERVELDEGFHTAESNGRCGESKFREHVEGAGIQGQADQKQAVKFNFCPRCGKRLSGNPDWVHTCTPPKDCEREDKAGLFQPDQEPVAWLYETPAKDGFSELTLSFGYEPEFDGIIRPLFVESNPKRQPLSNDEIAELWGWEESGNTEMIRNFARAIEKAHGIGE